MQANEIVGQVKNGTRRPDMNRKFSKPRRSGAKLPEGIGQNPDDRETVAETTQMPRRYGAGF